MTLLSRACVSPYWYFIETMPVCRISEIFRVKEWRDVEAGVRGRSRSLKRRRSIDHIRLFIGRCDNYEGGNVMISIILMFQCLKLQNFKNKFIF